MSDEATVRAACTARGQSEWFVLDALERILASRDSALADNKRLREALSRIASLSGDGFNVTEGLTRTMGRIANDALPAELRLPAYGSDSVCSEGREEELLRGTLKEIP